MKKLPLILAGTALLGGGALFAMQSGSLNNGTPGKTDVSASTASTQMSSDEQAAAGAEAMAERKKITDDPAAPTLTPASYDVTIVSYADYQCPFCRKLHPALESVVHKDGHVRVVYRDWAIFGAASQEAARAAIASQWQGKHAQFNDALMRIDGKLNSAKIKAAALKVGIDWAQLQQDLDQRSDEINGVMERTSMQAAQMGLSGTPALLVGPYLIPGAIDSAGLEKAVDLAREFNSKQPDQSSET